MNEAITDVRRLAVATSANKLGIRNQFNYKIVDKLEVKTLDICKVQNAIFFCAEIKKLDKKKQPKI